MTYREARLPAGNLLLDPNNYRFHDTRDFDPAEETRFHEPGTQVGAFERLRKDPDLRILKRSIITNGYVPVERLVVRPYRHQQSLFVVVEGNRRLAACKWILADAGTGVEFPSLVLDSIRELPVVVLEGDAEDEQVVRAALMGIRHVSGIKEWGGYQRAKLVVMMRDDLALSVGDVAEKLGISGTEVNRRYKGFNALEQMAEDEQYGEHAEPAMYALFHEAVALPAVRDWLGWVEPAGPFRRADELEKFYALICPRIDEDGQRNEPKVTTYTQVRELKNILSSPEARRVLLDDPDSNLLQALAVARQEDVSRNWVASVSTALSALRRMTVSQVKELSQEDVTLLGSLRTAVEERLSDWRQLSAHQQR